MATETKTVKKTTKKTTKKAAKRAPTRKLVIVESPGKVKNIKKYLGRGYEVVASVGHVRDLPKSKLGVDLENNFEPQYINIRKQSKTIKMLKEEAKKSKAVYLATDPDRREKRSPGIWHSCWICRWRRKTALPLTRSLTPGWKTGWSIPAGWIWIW